MILSHTAAERMAKSERGVRLGAMGSFEAKDNEREGFMVDTSR